MSGLFLTDLRVWSQPPYYDALTIEQKAALEMPNHHSRRAKQSNDYQPLRERLAAAAKL